MLNKIYKINESKAISETIDGETIIINLETGYYYSVNKTATVIWNKIKNGNSIQDISQYFLNHFEADTDTLEKSVSEIIGLFLKDDLILETDSDIPLCIRETHAGIIKEYFITPRIERYDDMAGALMSDPVHDVNEDGWPNLK